jgi:hypothetical protein
MHSLWDAGENGPPFHGHCSVSGERSFAIPGHPARDQEIAVFDPQKKIADESTLG